MRKRTATLLSLSIVTTTYSALARQAAEPPYRNVSLAAGARADDLLSRMTLDEKIGQMTQADSNSLSPPNVAELHLGSVLSGGAPKRPIFPRAAGVTSSRLPEAALSTRLGIPILYGIRCRSRP